MLLGDPMIRSYYWVCPAQLCLLTLNHRPAAAAEMLQFTITHRLSLWLCIAGMVIVYVWEVQERDENANSFLVKEENAWCRILPLIAENRRHMASGYKTLCKLCASCVQAVCMCAAAKLCASSTPCTYTLCALSSTRQALCCVKSLKLR